jgi:DNA-binding MarR family transcriptional regulator
MVRTNVLTGAELLRLTLLCRKIDKQLATSASLSVDELHCLGVLYLERPSCVKKLNELLGHSAPRTSKILRSLERRGYVVRSLHLIDRRMEQVSLTEDGQRAAETVLSVSSDAVRKLFSLHPEEGTLQLTKLMHAGD